MDNNNNKVVFQDLRQEDDDLYIDPSTGDFAIVASDEQHIVDIVTAFPGDYKEFPEVGVGIGRYKDSSGQQQVISREIQIQLTADGFQVKSPNFEMDPSGKLKVAPHAIR